MNTNIVPSYKTICYVLVVSTLVFLLSIQQGPEATNDDHDDDHIKQFHLPTVLSERLEQESSQQVSDDKDEAFKWTNAMLSWQRTSFHFQPQMNWMNDPNGPLLHMGWYHIFYQYNPDTAEWGWGNLTWGHAVSKDLINWFHLPIALFPDKWYDLGGVWSGSATTLPDGQIIMLYTSRLSNLTELQSMAYPADLSDPLLIDWVKYSGNPIMFTPQGIGHQDFRDPSTAWLGSDGKWRITIGSMVNNTGLSFIYKTTDFKNFELLDGLLHEVQGTGMWECIDFYPVSLTSTNGLDTSANGIGVKHLMKVSLQKTMKDYYAIGTYDSINDKWTPDDPKEDLGNLLIDSGKYYASKTFYDQNKNRRILWGWVGESDSQSTDFLKGWASLQGIPRTVVFDKKTGNSILQWPVEEVESLRSESHNFDKLKLEQGSVLPLNIGSASQLDIVATFDVDEEALQNIEEADADYSCASAGGAVSRGVLGPFGFLVLADESLAELTAVYFYIGKGIDGRAKTHFCADQLRSSSASDTEKLIYGSDVPVLQGEKLSMRLLVDHSIVESFVQEGRRVITSRVYPTKAINGAAKIYLFNNATRTSVTASVKVWQMNSATLKPYPLTGYQL